MNTFERSESSRNTENLWLESWSKAGRKVTGGTWDDLLKCSEEYMSPSLSCRSNGRREVLWIMPTPRGNQRTDPVPTTHAHLLFSLSPACVTPNSLSFPLSPIDQAQLGLNGSSPFQVHLHNTADSQGQRYLKPCCKERLIFKRKHGMDLGWWMKYQSWWLFFGVFFVCVFFNTED